MYLLLILAQEFTVQTPGQSVHVVWMRTHSKNLLNFNYALEESKANMNSVTKVLFEFEFKFKICQTCNILAKLNIAFRFYFPTEKWLKNYGTINY